MYRRFKSGQFLCKCEQVCCRSFRQSTEVSVIIEQSLAYSEVRAGKKRNRKKKFFFFTYPIQFHLLGLLGIWYMVQISFKLNLFPLTITLQIYLDIMWCRLTSWTFSNTANILIYSGLQLTQHPEFVFLDECVFLLSVWNWEHTSYRNTHKLKQLPTPV